MCLGQKVYLTKIPTIYLVVNEIHFCQKTIYNKIKKTKFLNTFRTFGTEFNLRIMEIL